MSAVSWTGLADVDSRIGRGESELDVASQTGRR